MLKLKKINIKDYPKEKERIFALVDEIWTRKESVLQAKHSIKRWGESGTETGKYFYIIKDSKPIGITGYFIPNLNEGVFGLRHHGTITKGAGKEAFELLVAYLKERYKESFQSILEFVPEGREELIPVFKKWGFELDPEGVPDWEPKREYYKHSLIYRRERE